MSKQLHLHRKKVIKDIERHQVDNRLTDAELSRAMGCNQSIVHKIKSDGVNCPSSLDKLILYLTNLGYNVEIQITKKPC